MMIISLVIPVYRNADTLEVLYNQIISVFNAQQEKELELYFVDDGSDDYSFEVIQTLVDRDARVRYLKFDQNYGQVAAIIAGLRYCNGDAAVVMSADLQDPVFKINEMIESWINGASIVICHRISREDKWIDRLFSSAFYRLIKLVYPSIPQGGFDFFLMDRSCINEFNEIDRAGRFLQGDVVKLRGEKVFLPYERMARTLGKSQWTFGKKVNYAIDAFLYEERMVCFTGGLVFLLGSILILFSLYEIGYVVILLLLILVGILDYRVKARSRNAKNRIYYKVEKQS